MKTGLTQIIKNYEQDIASSNHLNSLKKVEIKYLGRNGQLTTLLKQIKDLPDQEKRTHAPALQQAKQQFTKIYQKKEKEITATKINQELSSEFFDITLPNLNPSPSPRPGTIHPLATVQKEIEDIFSEMGFTIIDGPEVESEYYNFEALNIPASHPARDMQDTFFIDHPKDDKHGHLLLRTHTSPAQIRAMEKYGAPLRIIVPGRVFRYEATDNTHDSVFRQVEGMLIDKDISLANFKGIITNFLSRLYKKEITIRIRPGYFPFVEPGIEIDILWKKGKNGQPDKWLEVIPAGMIHPNVIKAGGLDPNIHQGWAFGMGLTRLVMIKYQIDNIRLFHSNDIRFLSQFK